jgi:phosphate transport system permease protein
MNRIINRSMYLLCVALTVLLMGVLLGIGGYLLIAGAAALASASVWRPSGQLPSLMTAISASAQLVLMACVAALPIGLLAGLYVVEYARDSYFGRPLIWACDMLGGVPGIVAGLAAYGILAGPEAWSVSYGDPRRFWAGAFALALVMTPRIAEATARMLRRVPDSSREAAASLGAGKAATIMRVVLPAAAASIAARVGLAIARVTGAAAPLLFIAGLGGMTVRNGPQPAAPGPTLPIQAYAASLDFTAGGRSMALAAVLLLCVLAALATAAMRIADRRRDYVTD